MFRFEVNPIGGRRTYERTCVVRTVDHFGLAFDLRQFLLVRFADEAQVLNALVVAVDHVCFPRLPVVVDVAPNTNKNTW